MEFLMKTNSRSHNSSSILAFVLLILLAGCSSKLVNIKGFQYTENGMEMFRNEPLLDVYCAEIDSLYWEADVDGRVYATPVVCNGIGILPRLDKKVHVFAPKTGKGIDNIKAKSSNSSSPAICDNLLYIAEEDEEGRLRCINLTNGKLAWSRELGDISAPLIVHDRAVYAGNHAGVFYSVNRFTGEIQWSFETGAAIMGGCATLRDRVIVGSTDGKIYCFSDLEGNLLWTFDAGSAIYTTPAVSYSPGVRLTENGGRDESTLEGRNPPSSGPYRKSSCYVATYGGTLIEIDARRGIETWRFETGGSIFSTPVIDRRLVYFGSNDGNFYALDSKRREVLWSLDVGSIVSCAPLVTADAVAFGTGEGEFLIVDKYDGSLLYGFQARSRIKASPVYYEGRIYVACTDRRLYCFGESMPDTLQSAQVD
jgi:outer membrane protein assembly factor BamB